MKLIIGGAYMGKRTWAKETYHLSDTDTWDLASGLPMCEEKCLYHLESLTWQEAQAGSGRDSLMEKLLPYINEDSVVIAREVGSGVVPMDKTERYWRELHGAVLKALATRADSVIRVFCGLGEVLK